MAAYKFRVTFEDNDDVSRDIEIKPTQTFDDLHHCIQQSIKFDASKPASFFMSNDRWLRGREISSAPKKTTDGKDVMLMKDAVLNKFIADPHQKIYYTFDTWNFFIELIKIVLDTDKKATYPRCVKINGDAPAQYKKIILPVAEEAGADELAVNMDEEEEVEEEGVEATSEEAFDDEHGFESEEGEEGGEEAESETEEGGAEFGFEE